jgi:cob(I)alamin adenosyltransferase
MSIVTKTGDQGTSALMYNRRVSKCHPRLEACGTVDELNAALGLARATAADGATHTLLMGIQKELVALMGELATATEDLPRYVQDGHALVNGSMTKRLEDAIRQLEAQDLNYQGWATPGANLPAAALDIARTVCRRAERRVCALHVAGQLQNSEPLVYLNRLSDLLWLLSRRAEKAAPGS